jgi:coproporphyrinogen III oxidase
VIKQKDAGGRTRREKLRDGGIPGKSGIHFSVVARNAEGIQGITPPVSR